MPSFDLQHAAETFFANFDQAFTSFDGAIIAARYVAPYLAVRANGTSECFPTANAIAMYFQKILDEYHRKECRSCKHRDLNVVAVGNTGAFATVTWDLLREDKSVVSCWRESYILVRCGDNLKACASMDHAQ